MTLIRGKKSLPAIRKQMKKIYYNSVGAVRKSKMP
jgi:hypothetical protein